jgi:hypothetical protein
MVKRTIRQRRRLGEFRPALSRGRVPAAAEEIRDPHNFISGVSSELRASIGGCSC